jgi:hypothetical protein
MKPKKAGRNRYVFYKDKERYEEEFKTFCDVFGGLNDICHVGL